MKIAIDVDGVLADHVPAVLEKLRDNHIGFDKTKSDIRNWNEPLPSIDSDLKTEIERTETDPDFIRRMPPIEGAIQATKYLAERGNDIVIVTHRPKNRLPVTHQWLEDHEIPHSREESLSTNGGSKAVADADILIDDYPGHIHDFTEARGTGVLFQQPWNCADQNEVSNQSDAFVAEDWPTVIEIIEGL